MALLFDSTVAPRFIPESIRWLMSEKDHVRTLRVLKRAARVNKVTLPEDIETILPRATDEEVVKEKEDRHSFWQAFKTPNLRKHTLIMFYVW